jgi:hypothetical protein
MNLYEEAMRLTDYAVYQNAGNNLAYPVLGFVDELFSEYIFEMQRGDRDRMVEEMLDVFWYGNQISYELSLLYGSSFDRHLSWTGEEVYISDAMIAIGTLAGIAKKIMRDGESSAYKKQDRALVALGVLRDFMFTQFQNLGTDIETVITELHLKLGSRQQRGVIKGDGDHR